MARRFHRLVCLRPVQRCHNARASEPGRSIGGVLGRRGQRQSGATRTAPRSRRRVRDRDDEGIIPVLARAVREVEAAVERGR